MTSDDARFQQAARQRLEELRNRAVIVLYKCENCDTVIPLWATHLQIAKGQRWPPFIENKACCSQPYLEPVRAREGSTHEVRVCMRLIRWGEAEAYEKHWTENLDPVEVKDLPYRPTMRDRDNEDQGEDHD